MKAKDYFSLEAARIIVHVFVFMFIVQVLSSTRGDLSYWDMTWVIVAAELITLGLVWAFLGGKH